MAGAAERVEQLAQKIGDTSADPASRLNTAVELRDGFENFCGPGLYQHTLKAILPAFMKVLDGPPSFESNALNQKLRNCVLEIIFRFPQQPPDALRPYVNNLVDKLLDLVRTDNEDNAALCMKILMDILKAHLDVQKAQAFLDVVGKMFDSIDNTVKETFNSPDAAGGGTTPNRAPNLGAHRPSSPTASNSMELSLSTEPAKILAKGTQSFKVLAECPLLVVSLFQTYKNAQQGFIPNNVQKFMPLIKLILLAEAEPQKKAHEEAKSKGEIFTGVSKEIKNRAAFCDMITAQVKTMSFLAYLLRQFSHLFRDFLPVLPDICIRMLRDCPGEKSAVRKELLVAIRHIINFNFREVFSKKVDELLDERTLIGDGLTVYESMRPLAFSMLADLIHHIRANLKTEQIQRTITLFSKNMLDEFPGTSFQTMSAKLLLNMAESIAGLENKEDGRYFLMLILRAIADKFEMMNREYPNAIKLAEKFEQQSVGVTVENHLANPDKPPDWDETDIFFATPIKTSMPRDPNVNPVDDNKFLFKNLMSGLKNLFFRLKNSNPEGMNINAESAPSNWSDVSFGYTSEEVEVITKLFHEGAKVFRYYSQEKPVNSSPYQSKIEYWANLYMVQSTKEERELLETFATVFHCVDPATFQEIFQQQIPLLFEMIFEHTGLLHIPQYFLASEATSSNFCAMLLQFLMEHIEEVGCSDVRKAAVLLRMFKLSFMAVNLFNHQNEPVLLPHVTKLVTKSIQLSTTADEPLNYFYLLRSLFRAIGGGKFEMLYKDILPLLEMLLETLNNLLIAATQPEERHLYVELCLTVPARLSNLLPHLSYLMRPLVVALRADSELVGQGLRTLELCVDNLTSEYLDPIMAPVIDELMQALWDHLKPTPYSYFHSHTTMRILGKLGGRNRKFLMKPPQLDFKTYADDRSSFDIRLIGSSKDRALPSDIGIDLAISKLREIPKGNSSKKNDAFYKEHAFKFIAAQVKLHFGSDNLPADFAQVVRVQAGELLENKFEIAVDIMDKSEREKSIAKKDTQAAHLKNLIKACIFATTLPDLKEQATALLSDVCTHFTLSDIGLTMANMKNRKKPFNVKSGEGPVFIDSHVLADAIVESLASDQVEIRDAAEVMVRNMFDAASTIFGTTEKAHKLPFFMMLAKLFCHSCYEEEWFTKASGSAGISILTNKIPLSDAWMVDRQVDFVRALMFLIKDIPQDLPIKTRANASDTLEAILKRCNKNSSLAELQNHQSRFFQLCLHIITELSHMNKHVRKTAQQALQLIAEAIGCEVHELVQPMKDRILQPIYGKPLRALPFPVQIGYIEAVTYCLKLQHSLIEFNDPLNRLILETLALTDADDDTLASKPSEYRTAESIVSLRVSCIQLLSTALSLPELSGQQTQQTTQTRHKIISVFFKSLYSSSAEVIDAAYAGLKAVLNQTNKLPKELLQSGLRPVLATLQDHKKINVPTLDGLARLLKLLTNYFKVEIGDRLINHMELISQEPYMQKISFSNIEQNAQMKIVTAALNIFHLLPPSAMSMMPRLVTRVLDFEEKLRRTSDSPFRAPLFTYLSRYPKETFDYFMNHVGEMKFGRFFAQMLRDPKCSPIREITISNIEDVIKKCFAPEESRKTVLVINGISIIHSLCKVDNGWLAEKKSLHSTVFEMGKHLYSQLKDNKIEKNLRLPAHMAGERVLSVLLNYLRQKPEDFDFFFQLIEAITSDDLKMLFALKIYLYKDVISSENVELRRKLISRCIELYNQRSSIAKAKAYVFRNIVNPVFAMDIQRQYKSGAKTSQLIDRHLLEMVHNKIWKSQLVEPNDENVLPGVDHSRLELLQMSALLLKYHNQQVSEFRKDVIKFGWSYIKLEDTINKFAAYVLIGFFIALYDSPAKIVREIYYALLKWNQNEGKLLVTQALDLIGSVLPRRLGSGGDPQFPMWAKLPKRLLTEESSNFQQTLSILNFVIRQPDLFYESREHFIPSFIPAVTKIAPPPSPSSDNKKLALNTIELIRNWEYRRMSEASGADETMTNGDQTKQPEKSEIPVQLRLTLIKYLAQLLGTFVERYPVPSASLRDVVPAGQALVKQSNLVCRKGFGLFYDLLHCWTDLDVDLFPKLTEQVLASERTDRQDEKTTTCIINVLQVIRIVLFTKSDEWIQKNIELIQKLLQKPLKFENPEVQDCIHAEDEGADEGWPKIKPLLLRVLEAIPSESGEEDEMEVDTPPLEFVRFISTVATETLSANNYIAGVNILWTLSKVRPAEIDQHIPAIMRALQQKLAKDHIANVSSTPQQSPANPSRSGDSSANTDQKRENEIHVQLILKTIDILSLRMGTLGEQRRPFLSVLASLVDKSQDNRLCEKILSMAEYWIFESADAWPTLKEKTAVLHKMLNFEARSDPHMLHQFLDLVIRIYEDPKIKRTELTVRLEHAFLVGTRAQDVSVRNRFMTIFDRSLTRTATARLIFVLTSQNWDTLAETFWLSQAIQLVLGSVDMATVAQFASDDFRVVQPSQVYNATDPRKEDVMVDEKFEALIAGHRRFIAAAGDVKVRDILEPLCQIQHTDPETAYQMWVALFPMFWAALSRDDRMELEKGMVSLLTKDYHQRQIDRRPNVAQALLEGVVRAKPRMKIPPHVVKYVSKTYDAWYTAMTTLEENAIDPLVDTPLVRESNLDALVETYAGLHEEDLFYGTWRRRCRFVETNAALSYEQNGIWDKAQQFYESAQIKARTGVIPFSQGEYMLWEDHLVVCAEKLQQWDVLSDFAKHENFNDLLLESSYRNFELWKDAENLESINNIIRAVSDAPTPRRVFFQAFMSLLKFHGKSENQADFNRICDEATQLSIRKWHQLPKRITNAHIPILQCFQQLVELHDAQVIFTSLHSTSAGNLDVKSQELKLLLGTWRDRLPNVWDDINAWQSLVTWRQHIFNQINKTYLELIRENGAAQASNSFAYRGFHETAWIINRFAHVARKHQLPKVCIDQLSKIYTLPNIEIQEAFLKLREQAKCHYQNPSELNSGLDVINNTNLNYFGGQQKAEFFTLKGMFLAKLEHKEEANDAFGTALYYDIRLPKAWCEWGLYNDYLFKNDPTEFDRAAAAVSCYLEAASLYKNTKSRKLLNRILWLLSLDPPDGRIAKAFDEFKGETPVWYWITFIPQLLTNLSHKEARISRNILVKIAKIYPQALYFLIRTNREDMIQIKRQNDQRMERLAKQKQQQGSPNAKTEGQRPGSSSSRPNTANGDTTMTNGADVKQEESKAGTSSSPKQDADKMDEDAKDKEPKKPWEYSEEIQQALKTSFPLLALSMEAMVDVIQKHFKCPPDEDAYRLTVALLNDGIAYIGRTPGAYAQDYKLPQATEGNIKKFAESILPPHIRPLFEEEFVAKKPTMYEYIHKLRKWRDKFEEKLDHRPSQANLETFSPYLSEFRFQKFDEVEVPGQYLLHKDKNQDFVRIDRFLPNVDLVRTIGFSHRRLKIRGHDGSIHAFAVQHPAARHSRREERVIQLFRMFNGTLSKRKESRRRNLNFFLPLMVPLAPSLRLVQEDEQFISLQGVYEDYCRRANQNRDEPMIFQMEKLRALAEMRGNKYPDQVQNLRMETFTAIQKKWVGNDIALDYFQKTYPNFADFWLFRRQFSYQYAALTFMTYVMHITTRYPNKLSIARGTGNLWASELIPFINHKCTFSNVEPVPFRLTPNLQVLMGPIALEGIYSCAVMAIARCLVEPDETELEHTLSVFVRDEVELWFTQQHRSHEGQLRERVQFNSDLIIKKTMALAVPPNGTLPANQTVIDEIAKAVDPMRLAQSDILWMPYL